MSEQKLWSGRFSEGSNKQADSFNTSLPFDCRMVHEDIVGSIVHSRMLGECGIISPEDAQLIGKTLAEILTDIDSGKLSFSQGEDIHMWVETELTARIGAVGKKLHTARSRNDQVALDLRMWIRSQIDFISGKLLREFANTLCDIAEKNLDTVMPGFTHLQHAQPITLAHHLMAYVQMTLRDIDRLLDCFWRLNLSPLGSCALAGTTHPIDREYTAKYLGFDGACDNTLDGVSDRDFCLEYLSCLSIIMVHLSRLSEEIILWSTTEFGFIELSDAYSTGSSIMPQKKNPDMTELIRGKSGRVFGDLLALLTTMKGLPLAYNKDMQEDKESVFDATDTVKACLEIITPVLATATFHPTVLARSANACFSAATDIADFLVKKGMPFREAHEVSGRIVKDCIEKDATIEKMTLQDFEVYSDLFDAAILEAVTVRTMVERRAVIGGPAPARVKESIHRARAELDPKNDRRPREFQKPLRKN